MHIFSIESVLEKQRFIAIVSMLIVACIIAQTNGLGVDDGCQAAIRSCSNVASPLNWEPNATTIKDYWDQFCTFYVVRTNCLIAATVNCSSSRTYYLSWKDTVDYQCLPSVKQVLVADYFCVNNVTSKANDVCYDKSLQSNLTCGKLNANARCYFNMIKQQCGDKAAGVVTTATFKSMNNDAQLNGTCVLDPDLYFNPAETPSSTGSTRATSFSLCIFIIICSISMNLKNIGRLPV